MSVRDCPESGSAACRRWPVSVCRGRWRHVTLVPNQARRCVLLFTQRVSRTKGFLPSCHVKALVGADYNFPHALLQYFSCIIQTIRESRRKSELHRMHKVYFLS